MQARLEILDCIQNQKQRYEELNERYTTLTPRQKLAAAFRLCALKGWDNWTYTHISVRYDEYSFLMNPFGVLFQHIKPQDLVQIGFDADPIPFFGHVNPTGLLLHRAIYQKRPDINAIFHLHTTHGVAVSAMKEGLLPISQFALHFYDKVSTHSYDSLILDENQQCKMIANDLGDNFVMLLQNHGTLTAGTTIEEAFYHTHHFEEACKVQCLALATANRDMLDKHLIIPSKNLCHYARDELLSFEKERGKRDWLAAMRLLPDEFFE